MENPAPVCLHCAPDNRIGLAGLLPKEDIIADYAFHSALIASVLLELWLEHKPLRYIGCTFRDPAFWKDFLVGIVWGSLSIGLVAAGMIAVTRELSLGQIGQGFGNVNWAYVLLFWLFVALAEESLARGYLLSVLRDSVGIKLALVIAAVIFAAIHLINPDYYWFAFLYAFLIAIMLGGIVLKRGSLGCVIGFHYTWNLLQDKGLLNMPEQGGEIIFAIVLLINIALVYWFLPRRQRQAG